MKQFFTISKKPKIINAVFLCSMSFFCFTLLLVSCSQTKFSEIDLNDIDYVIFLTAPKYVETMVPVSSTKEFYRVSRDTVTIYDKTIIKRYISLINQLSPRRDQNMVRDYRIASFIHSLSQDNYRIVLFGEFFGTEYEGLLMDDDPKLFTFLDSLLYAPYPITHWMTDDELYIYNYSLQEEN